MKITQTYLKKIIKEEIDKVVEESLKTKLAALATAVAVFLPSKAKANIFNDIFGSEQPVAAKTESTSAIVRVKIQPIKSMNLRDKAIIAIAKQKAQEQKISFRGIKKIKAVDSKDPTTATEFDVEFAK